MNPHLEQDQSNVSTSTTQADAFAVTPELVREIANRVFALFKKDLQIEKERMRASPNARRYGGRLW